MAFKTWLRNSRMKYSAEQTYIIQRAIQERDGWQEHLNKTQNFISSAINKIQPQSVRILGSGWLLDVPIDQLLNSCNQIVLTDILHPRQIVNKYSNQNKISFETIDITGGVADKIYNKNWETYDNLINSIKTIILPKYTEDLIISVNLISQLSIFITDYLSEKTKFSKNQLNEIAALIQLSHLENLPKGKSILISDYEEEFRDDIDDKLIGINPTIFIPIPRNNTTKEWNWKFDTQMTYREDCKTILKVIATQL